MEFLVDLHLPTTSVDADMDKRNEQLELKQEGRPWHE